LEALPTSLEETYRRILDKIPKGNEREIRTILMLLTYSMRPMTIKEVAEATALNLDKQLFDADADCEIPMMPWGFDQASFLSLILALTLDQL
jgi:hypothetical protein